MIGSNTIVRQTTHIVKRRQWQVAETTAISDDQPHRGNRGRHDQMSTPVMDLQRFNVTLTGIAEEGLLHRAMANRHCDRQSRRGKSV